jgi:hypothetical protein
MAPGERAADDCASGLQGIPYFARGRRANNALPQTTKKGKAMKALASALAVASATIAAIAPSPALAAGPSNVNSCGTISSPGSYVLTRNVSTSGNCFVISSDDVTFDFDGFTAKGDGTGAAMALDGHGIVVRNGTVRNFGVGISIVTHGPTIDLREGAVIEHMQVLDMVNFAVGGGFGTVRESFLAGNGNTAIALGGGPSLIVNNRVVGNARAGIAAGAGSTVSGNVISYNTVLPFSVGLSVTCPSLVIGNTIVGQDENVTTLGTTGCVMDHNVIGP